MKAKCVLILALLALSTLNSTLSTAEAQGTAFTYQGQLSAGRSPASGNYDFTFALFNTNNTNTGQQIGSTLTNLDVGVTNGLFIVPLNFGGVFTGTNYWLSIGVRTNGGAGFTALNPLQELTPTPYAIFANTSSNLSGTLPPSQLSAGTAAINISGDAALAGTASNFSGSLSGDVTGTQSVTVVSKVGGVTAANVASGANAANTLLNTHGTVNFFAGPLAGNSTTTGSGNTAVGTGPLNQNGSGGGNTAAGYDALFLNSSGSNNTAAGYNALLNNTGGSTNIALGWQAGYSNASSAVNNIDIGHQGASGDNNTIRLGTPGIQTNTIIAGVINGNGSGLTNLNASQLTTGTVADARLSTNVALLNGSQTFTGANTFSNNATTFASSAGSAAIVNDGGVVPGIVATGGLVSGHLRFRNGLEIWPDNFASNSGYLDVRNTNGSPTIALNGATGAITASNVTANSFIGNGSNLTSLNAGNFSGGVIPESVLPGFQASSNYSTVGGGQGNTVSGQWATIAGGNNNTNNSDAGTIAGGQNNTVSNSYQPTVGGGYGNNAGTNYATVAGGEINIASGLNATVGGGYANTASISYATIGGGRNNINSGHSATIAGGATNIASGNVSAIGGGYNNTASATDATVGGGYQNTASAPEATVGGGFTNTASGNVATVGGGYYNNAIGGDSTVGGGDNNISAEQGDTVAGGETNRALGGDSTVGGGYNNTSLQGGDTVAGGQGNEAAGGDSAVGGGYGNVIPAIGYAATVPGGANNVAEGTYSFAAGQQANALWQGDFVWADSQDAVFASTADDQFLIRAQGGVGIGTNNPNGAALAVLSSATGGWETPVSFIQNSSTAANASPALRVVGNGDTINGALSVSAQGTGLIAQFGNSTSFVSQLDTNGNWTANNFNGNSLNLSGNATVTGTLTASNLQGNVAVSGTLSAANTPGVNWSQSVNGSVSVVNGAGIVLIDSCTNAKPAVGYFVIMATATESGAGQFVFSLYDNTTSTFLTAAIVAYNDGVDSDNTVSLTWVEPITVPGGNEVFATYGDYTDANTESDCVFCTNYVSPHNLTVMYFPRLNN